MSPAPDDGTILAARRAVEDCRDRLGPEILAYKGEFVNSRLGSIRSAPIYFLGLDPGPIPDFPNLEARTVGQDIEALLAGAPHKYRAERWGRGRRSDLQDQVPETIRRILTLLDGRSVDLDEAYEIPISNLCFKRYWNEIAGSKAQYIDLARRCWAAHLRLLDVIRPVAIVALGTGQRTSAAAFFEAQAREDGLFSQTRVFRAGAARKYEIAVQGTPTPVLCFPHFSRGRGIPPAEVLEWAVGQVAPSTGG
ncbi:hypothetical protein [Azospirillum thiophilum]|uniref:Uracil-DNA glycosylase-like domain-containing protein n=1 Tax=Azospirillum thiophilum TaxID=528244 RepID=A0AAC8W5Z6_9PROT|nr:hypothetical protein [Azospirillum thiophilum]ALG75723.1 hypothetical protein AL072_32795 [Azospirillum thiophilum]